MIELVCDETFEQEVLDQELPVLVEFHASWCGPCKAFTPILEEIDVRYGGSLKLVRVDAVRSWKTIEEFGITVYPTILLMKSGKVVEQIIGSVGVDDLVKCLEGV